MALDFAVIVDDRGYVHAHIDGVYDAENECISYGIVFERKDGRNGDFEIASSLQTDGKMDASDAAAPFEGLYYLCSNLPENVKLRIYSDNEHIKNYCEMDELRRNFLLINLPEDELERKNALESVILKLNSVFQGRDIKVELLDDQDTRGKVKLNRAINIARNPELINNKLQERRKYSTPAGSTPGALDIYGEDNLTPE